MAIAQTTAGKVRGSEEAGINPVARPPLSRLQVLNRGRSSDGYHAFPESERLATGVFPDASKPPIPGEAPRWWPFHPEILATSPTHCSKCDAQPSNSILSTARLTGDDLMREGLRNRL